jgi:hypothetical protein
MNLVASGGYGCCPGESPDRQVASFGIVHIIGYVNAHMVVCQSPPAVLTWPSDEPFVATPRSGYTPTLR